MTDRGGGIAVPEDMKVNDEAGAQLLGLNQLDLRSSSTYTHTGFTDEIKWRTDKKNNGNAYSSMLIYNFYVTFSNNSNIAHFYNSN